jgi:hypothetical protein
MEKREKTFFGKLLEKAIPKAIPILIGMILKKQKFNKTPQDEKRIDDFTNNL